MVDEEKTGEGGSAGVSYCSRPLFIVHKHQFTTLPFTLMLAAVRSAVRRVPTAAVLRPTAPVKRVLAAAPGQPSKQTGMQTGKQSK